MLASRLERYLKIVHHNLHLLSTYGRIHHTNLNMTLRLLYNSSGIKPDLNSTGFRYIFGGPFPPLLAPRPLGEAGAGEGRGEGAAENRSKTNRNQIRVGPRRVRSATHRFNPVSRAGCTDAPSATKDRTGQCVARTVPVARACWPHRKSQASA